LASQVFLPVVGSVEYIFLRLLRSRMEFLGWPSNVGMQSSVGYIGLEIHSTKTDSTKHKGDDLMKVTKSLRESLFVMHLQRELDFRQMRGEKPDIKHSVEVAENNTLLTVNNIAFKS